MDASTPALHRASHQTGLFVLSFLFGTPAMACWRQQRPLKWFSVISFGFGLYSGANNLPKQVVDPDSAPCKS